MEIKIRPHENIVILDLYGKVDVNSANLIETVGTCLDDGHKDILCNLEEVESIDYMGISALVLAYKEVANNHGRMKFTSIPDHLRNLFCVTGLEKTIEIYSRETEAIKSFQEDKSLEDIKKLPLRRRFKRIPIDIKIQLKDKHARQARCVKGDILNLSAIGAYIYGCEKFSLGDDVTVTFTLPSTREELELNAKVVWLPDKQVQPHTYPGLGIEFCDMQSKVQEKILLFIEKHLSCQS
jgi:stage II sporulation protein AA (anti-sigma F factor antagonist)